MISRAVRAALLFLIVVGALVHLYLLFHLNINWDEFYYLSHVYQLHRGELEGLFQYGHVYLFSWLPFVPGTEIDQILAARLSYFLLMLGSSGFIYAIARRFLSVEASLFAIFCYFSYWNILLHGSSFRSDGLAVFLFLASLFFLLKSPLSRPRMILGALFLALAMFVTIKSLFFIPTIAAVLVLRDRTSHVGKIWREAISTSALIVAFLAFFLTMHGLFIESTVRGSAPMLKEAGSTALLSSDFFPQLGFLLQTLIADGFLWLYVMLGVAVLAMRVAEDNDRREALLLLSLVLPLLSLIVYRNSFPYFYVFLMPPVFIVGAVFFEGQFERVQRNRRPVSIGVLTLMIIGPAWAMGRHLRAHDLQGITQQRRVIEAVHRMFPTPVPYIDRNSMIASFPKVGFFMSSWGRKTYREGQGPVFEELIQDRAPVFLLVNTPFLEPFPDAAQRRLNDRQGLRDEDLQALRDNYVHHWGPIHVAGKRLSVPAGKELNVRILVPGDYTIEAPAPVRLDGDTALPGTIEYLSRGPHAIESTTGSEQTVVLRWGRHLFRPADAFPHRELYAGF